MDHMFAATIGDELHYLNYSVAVMFELLDRFGSVAAAMDAITAGGLEAFEAVRWLAVRMANEGELTRRELGYERRPLLTQDDVTLHMSPKQYADLTDAVIQAIALGYGREVLPEESEEQDLVLQELDEKKRRAGV